MWSCAYVINSSRRFGISTLIMWSRLHFPLLFQLHSIMQISKEAGQNPYIISINLPLKLLAVCFNEKSPHDVGGVTSSLYFVILMNLIDCQKWYYNGNFIFLLCGSLWNPWVCNFKGVIIKYHPLLRHKLSIIQWGGGILLFFSSRRKKATMHW